MSHITIGREEPELEPGHHALMIRLKGQYSHIHNFEDSFSKQVYNKPLIQRHCLKYTNTLYKIYQIVMNNKLENQHLYLHLIL